MSNTTAKRTKILPEKHPVDRILVFLTLPLICVGIFMVYDASYAFSIEHFHGDSFHYLKRQAIWAVIGLACLLGTLRVPYWRWKPYAKTVMVAAGVLLALVLVPHIGTSIGGSKRWLGHGGFNFQPSEFAKLALVLYMAKMTSIGTKSMRDFKKGLWPPLIVIGIVALLIAKEPDLGTTIVFVGTGLVMLGISGARAKHICAIVGSALILGAGYAISKPYRLHRLTTFLNPQADQYHAGYQVWHALIALGSGGWIGFGLGEGREKLYLPMANTDFIFPVIAEEWGLIGTLTLIALFFLIAWRGFTIAYRTKNTFGTLLAAGVTTMISLQAILNISVATASLPNTGVPLPFISYGGSSLVLMMTCVGLLLNISRYPNGEETSKAVAEPLEQESALRLDRERYIPRAEHQPVSRLHRLDRAKHRTSVHSERD